MKLYYADAERLDDANEEKLQYTYDGEFQNQAVVKSLAKKHGFRISKIVPQKGHHRCSYCGNIVAGENKEELCEDCKKQ